MNGEFGPFSVNPAQVVGLGGALFQELVNRLLDAEAASSALSGTDLHTSYKENVGDRGVDACVYAANQTEWIPAGDSAWQFKAGDLGPASCAYELEGATRAHEILRGGGKYRLVIGKAHEDFRIQERESKLREKAHELGFDVSSDNFKVIDGNQLARWVERYPQLAVSTILGGPGNVAIGIEKWQQSNSHQSIWTPSSDRDELIATVQRFLDDSSTLELRIEGVSGLGKTRSVLEALRSSKYAPLVLYVGDDADLYYPLIDHVNGQGRSAVIVIDECTRKRHNVLAQQLYHGGQVKLITIGERDGYVTQTLPIGLAPLPNEALEKVLSLNRPSLWVEARRVVVANCAGNVRWALFVADTILRNPNMSVGDLINEETLQILVGNLLSSGDDFLALSALALFSRYGVDRDARSELEHIARGLSITLDQLLAANNKLERLGLITKHGRYRSVTPQPVAVFLATRGWEMLGERILETLLPSLDGSMAERLFLRAADLGSTGPATVALNRILGDEGPFRSISALSESHASRLLIQLAIVSPVEVASHLNELIDNTSDEELCSDNSIRRDLVWALEKLVWHSSTFEMAANMLLRLAINENETWSNNSTGTWVNLFGAMLPATAARPAERMAYLERAARDPSPAVRRLAAQAADHALDVHGTVMVSGEVQGGVIVEPRGTPDTYGQLWDYMRSAIMLLQDLAVDNDPTVKEPAEKALVQAIHPILENAAVRDTLFDALVALPDDALRKVRTQIKHLYALFANVEKREFRAATNSEPNVAERRAGLDILSARLPQAAPVDELAALAFAHRWEWNDGELTAAIARAAESLPTETASSTLLELLTATEPPEASFELGSALYAVDESDETIASLSTIADNGNIAGLMGYLHASIKNGHLEAFDEFLDGPLGQVLNPAVRLAATVRGPESEVGWSRVLELLKLLPVHIGAPRMFGWHVDVDEGRIAAILDKWLPKIHSQSDYNFAIDVTALMVHKRAQLSQDAEERIVALVELRSKFPDTGQQSWDWVQLARRRVRSDVHGLLTSLLEQLNEGSLHTFGEGEEQQLIKDAIRAAGAGSLNSVLAFVQTGSWHLQMDFRGWLADVYSAADVIDWVGEDLDRARLVASLSGISDGPPSKVIRVLLDKFGSDDQVSSTLFSELVSGTWWGEESARLTKQIDQLSAWVNSRDEPAGVKNWAREVIKSLTKQRETALEREAEAGR